jgi:hypothetical protein
MGERRVSGTEQFYNHSMAQASEFGTRFHEKEAASLNLVQLYICQSRRNVELSRPASNTAGLSDPTHS